MKKLIIRLLKFFKKERKSDPVKYCSVFKKEGCCFVDGISCNYPNCNILNNYIKRNGK